MRLVEVLLVCVSSCSSIWAASEAANPLRFAWPVPATARVEISDERALGDRRRSIVLAATLRADRDGESDQMLLRFEGARLVSIDDVAADRADAGSIARAVAEVMKHALPTMVIARDGSYVESRDLDRVIKEIFESAGVPFPFEIRDAMQELLTDVAAQEWNSWVTAWVGLRLAPGDWTRESRDVEVAGVTLPAVVTWRALGTGAEVGTSRYELTMIHPSDSVRHYTSGFLVDMARQAGELGEDPVINLQYLKKATFSPLTERITIPELRDEVVRRIDAKLGG